MQHRFSRILGLIFTVFSLSFMEGCNPHHYVKVVPPGDTPEKIGTSPSIFEIRPEKWWLIFADPVLDTLIERGLKSNLDVKEAYSRLTVQYALLKQARAPLFPILSADYSLSRSRRPGFFGKDLGTDYRYGMSLSYELDVWKKIQSGLSASAFEVNATQSDVESLKIMVSTEIARDYFVLRELLKRLEILREKKRLQAVKKQFINTRYENGTFQSGELYLIDQQLMGLDAQIHSVSGELERIENALRVLVGEYPTGDWLPPPLELDTSIPLVPKGGVHVSILLKRPDVKAAEYRVRAQDERVAQAISQWFPSLGVNVGYGRSRNASSFGIISGIFWQVAFNASAVILEGGARKGRIEQERGALLGTLIAYHRSIMKAFEEAKTALYASRISDERLRSFKHSVESAESLLHLERARFRLGVSNGLLLLDRKASYLDAIIEYSQAQKDALLARVELVKALGGAWNPR